MRHIRGIAFDLEGTVVNVEPAHHAAHLQIAGELGLSLTLDDCLKRGVLPHFIGGPDEVIYAEMLALAGNPSEVTVAQLLARKLELYYQNLELLTIQSRPGWDKVFHRALAKGLRVSIGSLTGREEASVLLKRSGVGEIFTRHLTILREDVVHRKPAPDVFLKTAERMHVHPQHQLVFEDSPRGVQAALTAGSVAVGMPVYDLLEIHAALREAGAFRTYRSWEDIDLDELVTMAGQQD